MMDDDIRQPTNGDEKDYASMPFELRVVEVALDVVSHTANVPDTCTKISS